MRRLPQRDTGGLWCGGVNARRAVAACCVSSQRYFFPVRVAKADTPLMRQYAELKAAYPGTVLLFRVGDFYETFNEDAEAASKALNIVLTKRSNGAAGDTPLAGFPHHALEAYLPRLVQAGLRVAVCEQLEDPKQAKGLVKRGITEVVTPGVAHYEPLLAARAHNFLAALHATEHEAGLALLDVTTGTFYAWQGSHASIERALAGFGPSELVYNRRDNSPWVQSMRDRHVVYGLEEWIFQPAEAQRRLSEQFGPHAIKGFGLDADPLAVVAAGVVLHYLDQTQYTHTGHLTGITRWREDCHLWMDAFTVRNLELFRTASEGGTALVDVVDACRGPMGARLLRRWLAFPLTDRAELEARHAAVAFAQSDRAWAQKAGDWVAEVHDLERVATRCATRRIGPRELLRLADGLRAADELRTLVQTDHPLGMGEWPDSTAAANAILAVIHPDAPVALSKGGVIAPGVLPELDELRDLQSDAQGHLDALLAREQARTGIPSLRIASNGVFGYYLEVRNTHADKVPSDWIRKQTLVNAERYITPELKTLEEKLLQANDRIAALEGQMYQRLVDDLQAHVAAVLVVGSRVAEWDVLLGFADLAVRHGWARPTFAHEHRWEVREGRHPVIERVLPAGQSYIPNNVVLDSAGERMWMITGPNMSGKSALLRQTALHAILAQSGGFVPASHAELPLLDRLFVRVGASDNVSQGESTFMVEMTETASILHNLTPRSLVLLDEIGRGTATYDGISLAQAIAEYLHDHPGKPLVLFATHYHELNALESRWPGISNRHVAVQESNGKVVFLRTLVEGGSEHSFGLHVARMAGMPPSVVHRAGDLLQDLEAQRDGAAAGEGADGAPRVPGVQLSFIQWEDPAEKRLRSELDQLDLNALTPMDALMMLNRWKNQG